MNNKTAKRSGGEKRGNKYDRDTRGCNLNTHWQAADGNLYCAYCADRIYFVSASAVAVWQDRMNRPGEAPAEVLQQDRIDPTGSYTMGNLVPACRACNASLSDTPASERPNVETLQAMASSYRRGDGAKACTHGGHRPPRKR